MATNTTIQAINNAVPNVGLDTPHPEEPTRKLLNAILRDYLQALESLEDDTVTKSQIVQVFGDSQTAIISQDALTDYLSNLSFLQLADTPYVYAGSIGKFVRVNAAGDGLEFFEIGAAAISNSFNDLSDKPDFGSIPQLVSAADFASLPSTGDITKTYLTLDDGKLYYWSGSAYVVFTNDTATWAGIGGNIGDNAALTSALNDKADAEDVALKTTSIYAGTGLTGGGDLSADRTLSADIGTGAGQVMAGDDSRVTGLEDGAYAQIGTDIAPLGQDGLVPPANLPSLFSGDYDDLTNKPTLFSGAYDDLSGKPTLGTVAALNVDTDVNLAANSDALIPSQKAVKAYVDNNAGGVTLKPWTPDVVTGGSPLPFSVIDVEGGGESQSGNVFTQTPGEESDEGHYAVWQAPIAHVPDKFSMTLNKLSTDPQAVVTGYFSYFTIGGYGANPVTLSYAESAESGMLFFDNYLGSSLVDPSKSQMVDDYGAITASMPNVGVDVTIAIDNTELSASIYYDGVSQGTVYLLEPFVPDYTWISNQGLLSDTGQTAAVTLVDRFIEGYVPLTINGFDITKLDETAYPANATSNLFEITGTATPLQWDALGGAVVDGDLVAFDSAGAPFVVVTEPEEITAARVKQLYESNPDTNAFTDADVNKLANATDKTLPINWLSVYTSTFLIEPEHAGMSLWVTVDCVITVTAHSALPNGFNCEVFKAGASLIVSVVASGSDTIRDGKSIIISDASVFKTPSVGVIGLVGDAS